MVQEAEYIPRREFELEMASLKKELSGATQLLSVISQSTNEAAISSAQTNTYLKENLKFLTEKYSDSQNDIAAIKTEQGAIRDEQKLNRDWRVRSSILWSALTSISLIFSGSAIKKVFFE